MDPLVQRLQDSMKGAYTIERELGGGGMSRVFVAREVALDRLVVVKVLPADLMAGVNVERFHREIQLAARLQQANILPVLTAGEVDGIPYYTMPFVEGESLRARLVQGSPIPVSDVITLLRDVARALGAAHERGIVHRDIKPENVLVSHGAAIVADFGIAKAISAARADTPGGTLTSVGTSVGTPSYIAPEQAAGDAATDHRADWYSFGCMAYELLCGRTPFGDRPPQKLFVAHLSEQPENILERRPDTPPALAALVMQCLAKEPAQRPQSAAAVLSALADAASSGGHESAPVIALTTRRNLGRALAIYAASFIGVAILSRAAIIVIGLPDWVFPGALIVMALGLPVILFTSLVHHQSRVARMQSTHTPGGSATHHGTMTNIALKASPWLTWRRTAMGGAVSLGVFTALIGVWMLMRAFGIGPAGTLFAAGTLNEHDTVLITEFASPASDSTLGRVVTEALRTGLAESRSISLMSPAALKEQLRSMGRAPTTRVDLALGREIAAREGLKALVDGDILAIGTGYVLSARLIATLSGEPLATFKENAKNADDIIPAIDRVTRKLRERVGESLRNIQSGTRLDRVTTSSFEALRLYVQGKNAINEEADLTKGERLLTQAIHLDTGFAMAYRKLALELSNRGAERARAQALLEAAFRNLDRLGEVERHLTEAAYYGHGEHADDASEIRAYQQVLDLEPRHGTALNNLAYVHFQRREYDRAIELALKARASDSLMYNPLNILTFSYYATGDSAKAHAAVAVLNRRFPRNYSTQVVSTFADMADGRYDAAKHRADSIFRSAASDPAVRLGEAEWLSSVALARGQLAEGARNRHLMRDAEIERHVATAPLRAALDSALLQVWFRGDKAGALRTVNEALARHPLEALAGADRPYRDVIRLLALGGGTAKAKELQAAFQRDFARDHSRDAEVDRYGISGDIALAEQRWTDAATAYRKGDVSMCRVCALPDLARAYDLGGKPDSAIAVFERYVGMGDALRGSVDALYLAGAHKRLGELYDAKGDAANAAMHFAAFVDLWKHADAELQPKVREARVRLEALRAKEKR